MTYPVYPAPVKLFGNNANRRLVGFNLSTQQVNVGSLNPKGKAVLSNASSAFAVLATQYGQYGCFMGLDPNGIPKISAVGANGSFTFDGKNVAISGSITASSGLITGDLQIGVGGDIRSGMTAYQTGTGFWLGTIAGPNPQFSIVDTFGNFIKFDASSSNPIQISSTGVINVLSSKQIDDGGWKNLASYNFISSLPTTRAGYGITDAQGTLPNAAASGQVLQRDNGGSPYFAAKYGPETAAQVLTLTTTQAFTAATYVQVGVTVGYPKPSIATMGTCICYFTYSASVAGLLLGLKMQNSHDGGVTWNDTSDETRTLVGTGSQQGLLRCDTAAMGSGDYQVRLMAANASGSGTITLTEVHVLMIMCPNTGFYTISGPLTSTIPATGSGNCSAAYPTTTCTASENVTVNPSGGTPPYTYSWSVVSGTGTITAGATSQTCTVSDTETTSDTGATSNTTIKCTVTDSVPNNATSGNDVITNTFTRTYNAISGSVANNDGSCTRSLCNGSCTAQGTLTANPTGGNGAYTYSWSVTSGGGSIISGSTSQTCTVSQSILATGSGNTKSTTCKCAVNDTRGTGSVNMSGTVNLTATCNA